MRRKLRNAIVTSSLFVEAFVYLAWSRFLVSLSFSRVSAKLGAPMSETPYLRIRENRRVIERVSAAVNRASRLTFWDSTCLVRAIAAMKMLKRRRIESTLYLGTAKDMSGKMIAHAWLRSGSCYVTGATGIEQYTVVGKFANRMQRTGAERAETN